MKKKSGKSSGPTEIKQKIKIKRKGNYKAPPHAFKPGQSGNPLGRQKGSRNKFAEQFFKDFHNDWLEHGVAAIRDVRKKDPSTYLRVGASLLPKELNINDDKAIIEKMMEKMSEGDLDKLIAGLVAAGAGIVGEDGAANKVAQKITKQPDSIH